MKRYHLFIEAHGELSSDSHFIKVSIGQSVQEKRYFKRIEEYALAHNCYFHLYDTETSEFLHRIAESLEVPMCQLGVQFVTARVMSDHIKQFNAVPPKPALSHQQAEAISMYDSNFFFYRKNQVLLRAEAKDASKPKVRSGSISG